MKMKSISSKLGKLVNYATCVALLPFVVMLYQYQKNIQYLSLWYVLIFCSIAAALFLALYFVAKLIIKSDIGAFLFTAIWFFSFFLFNIFDFTKNVIPRATLISRFSLYFACVLFITVLIIFLCLKFRERLTSKMIIVAILVMLCVIIIQNVAAVVFFNSKQKIDDMFYKKEFIVTQTFEEQPNIYWIHCDGMLGFDSISRFFDDNQEKFTLELESRGFWINREAAFAGNHSTAWAIPTLMSPYYYDRVLSWELDPQYAESIPQNEELLKNPRLRLKANTTSNRIARERNETILAFNAAGYNTSTISNISIYFYPTVNQFYTDTVLLTTPESMTDTLSMLNNSTKLQSLFELFDTISYVPTPIKRIFDADGSFKKAIAKRFTSTDIENRVDLFSEWESDDSRREHLDIYNMHANSIYDTFERSGPRFTVYNFVMPHYPFVFDEFGNYIEEDSDDPIRYPAHHTFSANVLLKFLDLILEHDPDAVIVLQADHGLHGLPKYWGIEKTMDNFSCTREEASALWNQVVSAVRLPDEHMTPETEEILSDPRNISRYLINNFIGENYEYIPSHYRQEFVGPE